MFGILGALFLGVVRQRNVPPTPPDDVLEPSFYITIFQPATTNLTIDQPSDTNISIRQPPRTDISIDQPARTEIKVVV